MHANDEMWGNRNFRFINLVMALTTSPYNMFGPIMSHLMSPFGISVAQMGIFGATCVLAGVVGSVVFGVFLDRTRAYKKSLVVLSAVPIFSVICFRQVLPMGPEYFEYVLIAGASLTMAVMAAIVLCNTFAVEVTYPIEPSLVSSTLSYTNQIGAGILSILSVNYVSVEYAHGVPEADRNSWRQARSMSLFFVMIFFYLSSTIVSLFIKEDLRRTNHGDDKSLVSPSALAKDETTREE